jgi:sortase A
MSTLPLPPASTLRRPPRPPIAAAAILVALLGASGLVLLGQGLWIHAKALLAQVLLERAFAATLAGGHAVKPWSWADTWPVARIEVPRLGRSEIVLAGSSGQALAFGPGHVERTPEAGEPGTAVYAAHRDTSFAFLGEVRVGDEIRVTRRDGKTFGFRVTGTSVVSWDASGIDPDADGIHLVLATCWPLDAISSGPLRYLVHADMVDEDARNSGRVVMPALVAGIHVSAPMKQETPGWTRPNLRSIEVKLIEGLLQLRPHALSDMWRIATASSSWRPPVASADGPGSAPASA